MWIDLKGRCRTVPVSPADVLSTSVLADLDVLALISRDRVVDVLERHEDLFYEDHVHMTSEEYGLDNGTYVEVAPPVPLLMGRMESIEALSEQILAVPRRWRLEAIETALEFVRPESRIV